jgi:hypothetical protein
MWWIGFEKRKTPPEDSGGEVLLGLLEMNDLVKGFIRDL